MSLLPALAAEGHLSLTEAELVEWGRRLGRQIMPPLVITLSGDLGAGKTTLAKAICAGYGVTDEVTSPTFAIVHEYEAPKSRVHHVDLYRLNGQSDLQNVGWEDVLASNALVLVEWPERAAGLLPPGVLAIQLNHVEGRPDRRVLYAGGHAGHKTGAP